jgi:hypothetical protein
MKSSTQKIIKRLVFQKIKLKKRFCANNIGDHNKAQSFHNHVTKSVYLSRVILRKSYQVILQLSVRNNFIFLMSIREIYTLLIKRHSISSILDTNNIATKIYLYCYEGSYILSVCNYILCFKYCVETSCNSIFVSTRKHLITSTW